MSDRNVLFVETEGNALQSLMITLSGFDEDWQIVLSTDTNAALQLLTQRQFSIVLAGTGDNTAECQRFLGEVQKIAPAAIRFALLAKSHSQCLTSSLEFAYQCFSDQCPAEEIAAAIQRGLAVWDRCRENPALKGLLSQIHNIPTPPTLYFEVREEMNAENCNARGIASVLSRDPALCAKLLKIANSGFFAMPRTVSDVYEAVTFLGTDTISSLVLATHVFNSMPIPGINLDALWKHSLATSAMAREIVVQEGGNRLSTNTAGVAGLLHDIGQLIFLSNMPERYQPMLRSSGGDEEKLLKMEREAFGVGHPELSSHLLALWSLPEVVVKAVGSHHNPADCSRQPKCLITNAVFMAEWFLQNFCAQEEMDPKQQQYPSECLLSKMENWRETCALLMAKNI